MKLGAYADANYNPTLKSNLEYLDTRSDLETADEDASENQGLS